MLKFLRKPYPFLGNIAHDLKSNFLIGLFVACFLAIFQPFQINEWHTHFKLLKLLGFGMVSFIVPSVFNVLLPHLYVSRTIEDNWNVGKEIATIMGIIMTIALGNLLFGNWLGIMPLSLSAFWSILAVTCIIAIFPVTVHVIIKHNRLLRINLKRSLELSRQMAERHEIELNNVQNKLQDQNFTEAQKTNIELVAENNKDKIHLLPEQILFIESSDNYCNVVYMENNARKKHLLRSSLKRIEGQINQSGILRCHRTYIVNLQNVSRVEGNAAGYKLYFYNSSDFVPVSRNFVQQINRHWQTLNPQ